MINKPPATIAYYILDIIFKKYIDIGSVLKLVGFTLSNRKWVWKYEFRSRHKTYLKPENVF